MPVRAAVRRTLGVEQRDGLMEQVCKTLEQLQAIDHPQMDASAMLAAMVLTVLGFAVATVPMARGA